MRLAAALFTGAALGLTSSPAMAGAWTQPRGQGQVIVKYEDMSADQGFDADGNPVGLGYERRDTALSGFAEYGLTDRLTLQLKGDWQSGEDNFVDYEGRGPLEIGVTWQAWRDDRTAVSLYAGYADGGEGRNAGYADPGVGGEDYEVRAAFGRSFAGPAPGKKRRWWKRMLNPGRSFVDVQVARRMRGGLPDETRADLTFGRHIGERWMLLNQAYGGIADDPVPGQDGPRWVQLETSFVRRSGPWSVQLGWRHTMSGRETPRSQGPVIGVWRRF